MKKGRECWFNRKPERDTCEGRQVWGKGLVGAGNVSCVGRRKAKGRMGEGGVHSGSGRKVARKNARASGIVNEKLWPSDEEGLGLGLGLG